MLVLERKVGECIVVYDIETKREIRIVIRRVKCNRVKVGVVADSTFKILREETLTSEDKE